MTVKPEVKIDKLHPKLLEVMKILDKLWPLVFPGDIDGLNITSGHEEPSKHGEKSKHYLHNCDSGYGEAFDCRIKDVTLYLAIDVCSILKQLVDIRFDGTVKLKIYTEDILGGNAHIHIQLR